MPLFPVAPHFGQPVAVPARRAVAAVAAIGDRMALSVREEDVANVALVLQGAAQVD